MRRFARSLPRADRARRDRAAPTRCGRESRLERLRELRLLQPDLRLRRRNGPECSRSWARSSRRTASQFVGEELVVDFLANGAQIPDWWRFKNTGTCRQTAFNASVDFFSGPDHCLDYWRVGARAASRRGASVARSGRLSRELRPAHHGVRGSAQPRDGTGLQCGCTTRSSSPSRRRRRSAPARARLRRSRRRGLLVVPPRAAGRRRRLPLTQWLGLGVRVVAERHLPRTTWATAVRRCP